MNNRRKLLSGLTTGLALLPALAVTSNLKTAGPKAAGSSVTPPPTQGRGGNISPNIGMQNHDGKELRLFD